MNDGARILIVDDDPHLLGAASRLLRQAGCQVLGATSGEKGLRLAVEHRPELLLVDADIPDLEKIEVCRQLKADPTLSDTLIVLLSAAETDYGDQALGLGCGIDGYITRPLPDHEFLARVETLVRLQRALAERDMAVVALQKARDRFEGRLADRTSELRTEAAERKRAEDDIRNNTKEPQQRVADRTRELSTLYDIAAVASESLDLKTTLQQVLVHALAAMRDTEGSVHLLDKEGGVLHLAVQQGVPPEIAAQLPRVPVIMLTSHDSRDLRREALRLGVCCALDRPVPGHDFLDAVREASGQGCRAG